MMMGEEINNQSRRRQTLESGDKSWEGLHQISHNSTIPMPRATNRSTLCPENFQKFIPPSDCRIFDKQKKCLQRHLCDGNLRNRKCDLTMTHHFKEI